MPNPFISMFALQRQGDVSNFDSLIGGMGQQAPAAGPMQSMATGPSLQFPVGGQTPQEFPPTGGNLPTPPDVWNPPSSEQLGYEPPRDTPTGLTGQIYNGLISRGLPEHIAAGFMENFADESGFSLGIQEHNPRGGRGGRGLYQLTGPRREAFEAKYGEDGYTVDNQLDFLVGELGGSENEAWSKIQQARTPGEAAALITTEFLRPASEHANSRVAKYLGSKGGEWLNSNLSAEVEDVDYSEYDEEQEKAMEDMSPEAQKRRKIGLALSALGTGFGQMSRGQTVDISDVVGAYQDRQSEMRDRIMQLQQERIRRGERQQGLQIDAANREDQQQHDRAIHLADVATRREDIVEGREYTEDKEAADRLRSAQTLQTTADILRNQAGDDPNMIKAAEFVEAGVAPDKAYELASGGKMPDKIRSTLAAIDLMKDMSPEEQANFKEMYGVGEGGTTITFGDKESVKYDVKQMTEFDAKVAEKEVAERVFNDLEALNKLHPDGQIPTGAWQNVSLSTREFMMSAGLLTDKQELTVSLQEAMNMATRPLVSTVREPGATSNIELPQYIKSNPNLSASPFANKIMSQARQNEGIYYRERKSAMRKYFDEHDQSLSGWEDHLTELEKNGDLPYNIYNTSDMNVEKADATVAKGVSKGYLKAGDVIVGPNGMPMMIDQAYINEIMGAQ